MVYPENVTLYMKSSYRGKPMTKSLDAEAKLMQLGGMIQMDLNLTNTDLRMHRFKIEPGSIIIHNDEGYRCIESSIIGRPHHILVYAEKM